MNRFQLQKSTLQQGWWVLADKENGIVCPFQEHQFNETQKITGLEDYTQEQVLKMPTIMREMGDWLATHHYNIAMPPVQICIQQTEDDECQFVEHGEFPRFRVMIDDECTAKELADALKDAAKFLHDHTRKGGKG